MKAFVSVPCGTLHAGFPKTSTQRRTVHLLRLLATMSRTSNFSVGCYCTDETHCHRSVLRALLKENGGTLA